MICKKTVLVLGAGASDAYQFPLGRQLVLNICNSLDSDGSKTLIYLRDVYRTPIEEITRFGKELRLSNLSIDAFLENHPYHLEIGKRAIALALIPNEIPLRLVRSSEMKWYEFLFEQMGTNPDKFRESARLLSIVTFNYDRSIEYFFWNTLQNAFDPGIASSLLSEIKFVHVYGQLGKPLFLDRNGRDYDNQIQGGFDLGKNAVDLSISEIKIMPERLADSPEFNLAHELIREAHTLCFLGFGYDQTNLERLGINQLFKGNRLLGTVCKLGTNEIRRVRNYFSQFGLQTGKEVVFEPPQQHSNDYILNFLKDKPAFD